MNTRESFRPLKVILITIFTLLLSTVLTVPSSNALDITFTWTPSQDQVIGYKLYYKAGNDPDAPFTGTGIAEGNSPISVGNTTSFTVTGLSDNDTYQFALTAYVDNEESGYSDIVTITPLPTKNVTFAWSANTEPVIGYKLYYKLGGLPIKPFDGTGLIEGSSPIVIGDITTFTVSGIDPDQIYHFALTAYDASGESDYSEILTVNPTPVPVILNIQIH